MCVWFKDIFILFKIKITTKNFSSLLYSQIHTPNLRVRVNYFFFKAQFTILFIYVKSLSLLMTFTSAILLLTCILILYVDTKYM